MLDKNKILRPWTKFIFSRIFIFYLAVLGLVFLLSTPQKMILHGKVVTLSRLMPSYDPLWAAVEEGHKLTKEERDTFVDYFRRVQRDIPQDFSLGTDGFLGFCFYEAGDLKKAEEYYLKALTFGVPFTAYYHNLGVIYLDKGQYQKAMESFQKAVKIDTKSNVDFLYHSRVSFPIVSKYPDPQDLSSRWTSFQRETKKLYVLSVYLYGVGQSKEIGDVELDQTMPDRDFLYYQLARKAFDKHYYPEAAILLEKCLAINKSHFGAMKMMAETLQKIGKLDVADKFLQSAEILKRDLPLEKMVREEIRLRLF
ncbi:MAG: tetratricopeptide repeat protein [Candidatus Omnitrophica bacterium]|nr:tetratricopeptide repeat protein [Candidatus Omnitrophota bacterium]